MRPHLDEYVVDGVWHWLIEDCLDKTVKPERSLWEFAAGIFNGDNSENMTIDEIQKHFYRYFYNRCGINIFVKCPKCGKGITFPRQNDLGYFIGCSRFPKCHFMATNRNRHERLADE